MNTNYNYIFLRIEKLNNGWDKEADDILQEIINNLAIPCTPTLEIYMNQKCKAGGVRASFETGDWKEKFQIFTFSNQCQKMSAFKKALVWLLDHSDIKKDEKQEKIEALEIKIKEIQEEIEELKEGEKK